jgi:hypothetical protein
MLQGGTRSGCRSAAFNADKAALAGTEIPLLLDFFTIPIRDHPAQAPRLAVAHRGFIGLFGLAIKNSGPMELRFFLDQAWTAPISVVILAVFAIRRRRSD